MCRNSTAEKEYCGNGVQQYMAPKFIDWKMESVMSLTSFLKQSSDIRIALRQTFPLPRRQGIFPTMQAAPLTTNFALVGQAFDYFLRFYIQRHNPCAPQNSVWVANVIRADLVAHDDTSLLLQRQEQAARVFLEQAHIHHNAYLASGEITDDLLKSCLNLASIDGLVRAGEIRGSIGQADPRDLQDLRNLFALIPQSPFLDGTPCLLNPAFSFPSGADCDLLIGTTLIEIKTTKFPEVKQDYYQQLLGYYLLNLADQQHPRQIEYIGVYFSRHGHLWTVPIEELGGEHAFHAFLPLWNEHVARYHRSRRGEEAPPTQSLQDLIAQVNRLSGVSSYMAWLSRLSAIDFQTWKSYDAAPYFVQGALSWEDERRRQGRRLAPIDETVDNEPG